MDKQQQKLKNQELKLPRRRSFSFIIGSIVATLIAATPFIFNLYESVPDKQVWDTFLFTYNSQYYESVYVVAWTLANKITPLFLLFLWFFTCRHWWYHTLLVPIAMYIYQMILVINGDLSFIDNDEILYLLPLMAIVIPSIYLIRAKMFNKLNEADKTMQELEDEFMIKPKGMWNKVKQYF